MGRYLRQATISVEAESEAEATTVTRALCDMADRLGMGDCVLAEPESGDQQESVKVIYVDGREDGIYVFADLEDAHRFEAAANAGGSECHNPALLTNTPLYGGPAAERLIASERGNVLEGMGCQAVGEDVREGLPFATIIDRVVDCMDEEEERKLLPLLQQWAEEDAREGDR